MGISGTFLYRPSYGAKGLSEYTFFDAGLARADAELVLCNTHRLAPSGVHGITGSVVGDTDSQSLSNKTLVAPIIASFTNAQHSHLDPAGGGTLTIAHSGTTGLDYGSSGHTGFLPSGGASSIVTVGTIGTGTWNATAIAWAKVDKAGSNLTDLATRSHSSLSDLTTGDPHTQYALLAGRSGGQTFYGDTASGGNLVLHSTTHASKGKIYFGSDYYDQNLRKFVIYRTISGSAGPADMVGGQGGMHEGILYDNSTDGTSTDTFIAGRSVIIATASTGHNTYGWGGAAYMRCNAGMHAGNFGFGYADDAAVNGGGYLWGHDCQAFVMPAVTSNPSGGYGIEVGVHPCKSDMDTFHGALIWNPQNFPVTNYRAGDGLRIAGITGAGTDGWINFINCIRNTGETRFVVAASGSVGVGCSPNYSMDIRSIDTNGTSWIHTGYTSAGADDGGWFGASGAYTAIMAAGGASVGGSWIAKSAQAFLLGLGGVSPAAFRIFVNTGLTIGNSFSPSELCRINTTGVFKIGGSAARAATEGTNHIDIFNGTAPSGALTNGASIYTTSGEMYTMDATGNATLQTPHDRVTNEWIYKSIDTRIGKTLKIDMERLMRRLDKKFGGGYIQEYWGDS